MAKKKEPAVSPAIRKVPLDARPAVCEWLNDTAEVAEQTAFDIKTANRTAKDPGMTRTAEYWSGVAACCRMLSGRLAVAQSPTYKRQWRKKDGAQ